MNVAVCRKWDCPNPITRSHRGLCSACYQRAKRRDELHLWPSIAVEEPRPWPIAPLYERTRTTEPHVLADRLGVDADAVQRAEAAGLTDIEADHWATRLGLHAACLWGSEEWMSAGITFLDDVFVNGDDTHVPGWRQAWEWHVAEAVEPTPLDSHRHAPTCAQKARQAAASDGEAA